MEKKKIEIAPWFPDHMLTEAEKLEFKQEETKTLERLGALLGREVKGTEHIWKLAQEVEKKQFFEELNESVKQHQQELANNPELRKEEEEEQRLWDNTLMDGLEDE